MQPHVSRLTTIRVCARLPEDNHMNWPRCAAAALAQRTSSESLPELAADSHAIGVRVPSGSESRKGIISAVGTRVTASCTT